MGENTYHVIMCYSNQLIKLKHYSYPTFNIITFFIEYIKNKIKYISNNKNINTIHLKGCKGNQSELGDSSKLIYKFHTYFYP